MMFDNNFIHSHEINKFTTETDGQTDSTTSQQHFALYNSNTGSGKRRRQYNGHARSNGETNSRTSIYLMYIYYTATARVSP